MNKEHLKTAVVAVGVAVGLWVITFLISFLLLTPKRLYEAEEAKATKVEAPDSLRRRAKQLTDEIETFQASRNSGHPPHSTQREGEPAAQQKINVASDAYDRETDSMCATKFHDRMAGIAREMRAKGLDAKWLDAPANPCPNDQDVSILRELSFHLDERDNAIRF